MKAKVEIDSGVCGFQTTVHASTEDAMNVHLEIESECATVLALKKQVEAMNPFNSYEQLMPTESAILQAGRALTVSKGCCEACVVAAGICKALYVAANLALPRDVGMKISKED